VAEALPTALGHLVSRLERLGFAVTVDERESRFGDRHLELHNPARQVGRSVRLYQDRGPWSVEIDVAGKWRDPYQLVQALDESEFKPRALSHEERLRYTLEALERLPVGAAELRLLSRRLQQYLAAYWRRLGVEIEDPG
jgi:hypothetical protein